VLIQQRDRGPLLDTEEVEREPVVGVLTFRAQSPGAHGGHELGVVGTGVHENARRLPLTPPELPAVRAVTLVLPELPGGRLLFGFAPLLVQLARDQRDPCVGRADV
jgi:hypothetical protein